MNFRFEAGLQTGRFAAFKTDWTDAEDKQMCRGMQKHNRDWASVAAYVETRTVAQV